LALAISNFICTKSSIGPSFSTRYEQKAANFFSFVWLASDRSAVSAVGEDENV
jgi:hypothetical protein